MKKNCRLTEKEFAFLSGLRGVEVNNPKGRAIVTEQEFNLIQAFRLSDPETATRAKRCGNSVHCAPSPMTPEMVKNIANTEELKDLRKKEKQFNDIIEFSEQVGKFELQKIDYPISNGQHETIAIIQNSDHHIDEVVKSETVLGLNEYNFEIAKQRSHDFYSKAAKLITHHQKNYSIKKVIVNFGGDGIGSWIHDELEQTNSMSPNDAIYQFKSMSINGLKHLHDTLNVDEIVVVCICGNHPRETKKIQFANFVEVSKEYNMYRDMELILQLLGYTKFKFIIPAAEMAVVELFGKRYLFAHGHQFKFAGGIGGIFPPMMKWFANINKTLNIECAFIGHWHQSIFTKKVIVNGTLKGYDAFAIGHGLEYERPSQNLVLLDSEYGLCNFQPIFV